MPCMVPAAEPVLYRGELVRSGYLNRKVLELFVHVAFFTVGYPDLLEEDQLWREFIYNLAEIQEVSVITFNVESEQLHV